MEMILNIDKLISEKNKRAWTQGHLAEVCGLSLRTIQRIEKTGIASHDTIKALASVFEVSIEELIDQEEHKPIDEISTEKNREKSGAFNYFSNWLDGKRMAKVGLFFILLLLVLSLSVYYNNRQMVMSVDGIPWYFQMNNKSFYEILSGLSFFTLLPGIIMLGISQNIYKYNKPWSYWLLLVASIIFLMVNIKIGIFVLVVVALLIKWLSKKYA